MPPAIRPSSDVRKHYNAIAQSCRDDHRPTVLTVNGRGDTVIMGIEDYEEQIARLELLETLVASERDVAAGRVAPMDDTLQTLRNELTREIA